MGRGVGADRTAVSSLWSTPRVVYSVASKHSSATAGSAASSAIGAWQLSEATAAHTASSLVSAGASPPPQNVRQNHSLSQRSGSSLPSQTRRHSRATSLRCASRIFVPIPPHDAPRCS